MGGQGSGRPPNVIKRNEESRSPIATAGDNMFLPNYSGLKKEMNTEILFIDGDNDNRYKLDCIEGILVSRHENSGDDSFFAVTSKDADGTDDAGFIIGGKTNFNLFTNYEDLTMKWNATDSEYQIFTERGGTGTARPLNIYTATATGDNKNQLVLNIDNSIDINEVYKLSTLESGGDNFIFQEGLNAGKSIYNIYTTKDGDGTDNNFFAVYGVGNSADLVNIELLRFGWSAGNEYEIATAKGGTGTDRDLQIYAGATNKDEQIWLNTSGNVGINAIAPSSKLEVGGAISSSVKTVTTSADDTDVSGVNTLFITTAGGSVVIGGFTGGVAGQVLYIARKDATNDLTLEHNEGTGNQDIIMHEGTDETIDGYGGFVFICDGTDWFDCSHAKHV